MACRPLPTARWWSRCHDHGLSPARGVSTDLERASWQGDCRATVARCSPRCPTSSIAKAASSPVIRLSMSAPTPTCGPPFAAANGAGLPGRVSMPTERCPTTSRHSCEPRLCGSAGTSSRATRPLRISGDSTSRDPQTHAAGSTSWDRQISTTACCVAFRCTPRPWARTTRSSDRECGALRPTARRATSLDSGGLSTGSHGSTEPCAPRSAQRRDSSRFGHA